MPRRTYAARKAADPEGEKERNRKAYQKSADRRKAYQRAFNDRAKASAIDAYGGVCDCCGEDDIRFLTIDHINNDGAEHRRQIGNGGVTLYNWLKKNDWPEGFRVLCANCNLGRHWNGGTCPHHDPLAKGPIQLIVELHDRGTR